MEMDKYDDGVPSWVDLGTPEVDGAVAFYGGLFGWEVPEGVPEAGGYRIAHLRGRAVAGLGPQQNPGPPVWATYVNVVDAAATTEKVKPNGGQVVVEPFAVLDVGTMAVFMDPTGAFISIWQPDQHTGAGIVNEPGTYSWSELITNELDKAKTFYGAVFGWGSETHGEGPGAYTEWKLGGRSIGGMMRKPPTMPDEVPSYWGVYFAVEDADAAVKRITELGGSVMVGPMDIEPGRFASVADPSGAMFNVMAMNEGAGG